LIALWRAGGHFPDMMPVSFGRSQYKQDDDRISQKGREDNSWHGVFFSIAKDRIPRRIVAQWRRRRNAPYRAMHNVTGGKAVKPFKM
jgi:hypothetical protein